MKTINLSPSQYRVVTVRDSANASSNANASSKPKQFLPDTHPIYGLVNLALLAVIFYLLWANI